MNARVPEDPRFREAPGLEGQRRHGSLAGLDHARCGCPGLARIIPSAMAMAELRLTNVRLQQANSDLASHNAELQASLKQHERQMDEDGHQFLQALAIQENEIRGLKDQVSALQVQQQQENPSQANQGDESGLPGVRHEWDDVVR